jgi:hypothetical protein
MLLGRMLQAIQSLPCNFRTNELKPMAISHPRQRINSVFITTDIVCHVSTAERILLGGRCSIPGSGKKYFSISQLPDNLWGPPSLPSSGYRSTGLKQQGLEADHSPPSSNEVKSGGAIPPHTLTSSWHDAQLIKHTDKRDCLPSASRCFLLWIIVRP